MSDRARWTFIAGLVWATVLAFFVYMRWTEGEGSWLGQAEAWIDRHDLTVDLITVWCLAVGFAVLALVEFATWLSMRGALDQTRVGQRLRPKKLGYALIAVAMSTLYSMTLYAYYQHHQFGVWSVFALRVLIIVGIVTASVFGVRFITALRDERNDP